MIDDAVESEAGKTMQKDHAVKSEEEIRDLLSFQRVRSTPQAVALDLPNPMPLNYTL